MIWQEKVSLIVMLTKLVENGKTKSDHYWPFDQQKEEACEGLSIEMVSFLCPWTADGLYDGFDPRTILIQIILTVFQSDEIINAHWTERTFYLSNDETSRKIKQIQLTTWSETELPDDIQFYQFLRHVKEEQTILENSAGDENPVVVHCSDGSLRTGLYICADQLLMQVRTLYLTKRGLPH